MKNKISLFAICSLLFAICCSTPALADNTGPYAYAPQQPNFYRLDTIACPIILTNGQTQTFTAGGTNSYQLVLRQNVGLSVFAQITATNSITATPAESATLYWDTTPDGTNWTTGQPVVCTAPLVLVSQNTNTVLVWTNWPVSVLNNVRKLQLTKAVNGHTNTIVINKIWYSYSGQ